MFNLGNVPDAGLLGGSLTGGDPAGAAWSLGVKLNNLLGVSDNLADDVDPDGAGPALSVQLQNAATATTGFELAIPLTQIGLPANPAAKVHVHLIAMLTGNDDYRSISNQLLPAGLGGGLPGFVVTSGPDVPTDLTNIDGNGKSYACMDITLGYCNEPLFDGNDDHFVDMSDFGLFQACYTGPALGTVSLSHACACFDWDTTGASDGDVSEADLEMFIRCFSGPSVLVDPGCADPQQPT
jgi:hypothetical protein